MMKKLISCIGIMLLLFSCSKPESETSGSKEQEAADELQLSGTQESIQTGSDKNQIPISFTTNRSWTATSNVSWASVNPGSGESGTASIIATVEKNTGSLDRTGIISIKAGTAIKTVTIIQANESGSAEDPVTKKLPGTWKISDSKADTPISLIFQDGSNGFAISSGDVTSWFGLTLINPTEFTYSIKNNNAVTIKLTTGRNINTYFDTNYQGEPILNFDAGSVYYQKVSDSTDLPKHDEKDDPFVKITKIVDCTDNSITVECEVINSRILSLDNITFGAKAVLSGGEKDGSGVVSYEIAVTDLNNNKYECTSYDLDQSTTYDVYAYVRQRKQIGGGQYDYSSDYSYSTNKMTGTTTAFPSRADAPITTPGNTVDLGLPSGTLWADRNIGSAAMASDGAYFTWGQTKESSLFYFEFNQDCIDENNILKSNYDVASVNWGNGWRLPTYDEVNELKQNCTWEKYEDTENNIYGMIGTSEINGNWIFFPKSGYYNSKGLQNYQKSGFYLTSQYKGYDAYYNKTFYYMSITTEMKILSGEIGPALTARPVKN